MSDFGCTVDLKSKGNQKPKDGRDAAARKPVALMQRIDPSLMQSMMKDATKTPTRPKPTVLRPMDPPAFVPTRPGPGDASTSKATPSPKPRFIKPPPFQQPSIKPAVSLSRMTTPITARAFRLDRILPLSVSPARKVVPFNELPKPKPHLLSPSLKSPKAELRVLSKPNFSLSARAISPGMKAMSALNQPLSVDFEGDLWGDNSEDVFGSRELMRGLILSPEKAGTKGKKFIKYVQHYFSNNFNFSMLTGEVSPRARNPP